MARIDWVKRRLENWARWKVREQSGGLGFSRQASFLRDAPAGSDRESKIPIDEIEASVTDEAIEAMKGTRPHLYETVQLIYFAGIGCNAASRYMGVAPSTVKANLEAADRELRVWFNERDERMARQRRDMEARLQAVRSGQQVGLGSFTT